MSDPRRNRPATAMFLAGILVAAIAGYALLRTEPAESPPPVAPLAANDPAPETAGESAANRAAAESAPTAAATSPDAQVDATGTVDVRLRFLGVRRARVQFVVTDDAGTVIASADGRSDRDEFVAKLTVPAEVWIRVGAITFDNATPHAGTWVPQISTLLAPGERTEVELECSGIVTQLRLVGPSPRLLPHVTVALQTASPEDAKPLVLHPTADGTLRCHLPNDAVRAMVEGPSVLLTDENGLIDLSHRDGVIDLTPVEPLLGIVVEHRGAVVPSKISLWDPMHSRRRLSACTVTTRQRGDAARFVYGWTDELLRFRVPIDEVRRDADVWTVEPREQHRLGLLEVTFHEPDGLSSRLELVATRIDGGEPHALSRGDGTLWGLLPPDAYRLEWGWNGGRGPTAAEFVRVHGGIKTTLHLSPPVQQRWQVRVVLPRECTHAATVRLGGFQSIGTARDGVVPIDLQAPPRVGEPAEVILDALESKFAATVTAVDGDARRAEVASTLADAVWLRLVAPPMAGGKTDIYLEPEATMGEQWGSVDSGAFVPMLRGHPRAGCVIEKIDGDYQLVRWFRVQAGEPAPPLTGQGRWTTLVIERQFVRAKVHVEGPRDGEPFEVCHVESNGPHRLFVADGTRAVHVDLEPGGRRTFDAALSAFVVR